MRQKLEPRIKPVVQKLDYSCGTAALVSALQAKGIGVKEEKLIHEAGLTHDGLSWDAMIQRALSHGQKVDFLYGATGATFDNMVSRSESGQVLVVCWQSNTGGHLDSHYSTVAAVGERDILIADPSHGHLVEMPQEQFETLWHDDEHPRSLMALI